MRRKRRVRRHLSDNGSELIVKKGTLVVTSQQAFSASQQLYCVLIFCLVRALSSLQQ